MSGARRAERWGFALGLLGTLVLILGDQLLYWAPVSGAEFAARFTAIVAAVPPGRALAGAALGPLGGFLYLAGFAALWSRLRGGQPVLAGALLAALAFFIVAGSTYHTLWGPRALAMQAAAQGPADGGAAHLASGVIAFARTVFRMAQVAGWAAQALLVAAFVRPRCPFPRKVLAALPAWWYLALSLAAPFVPAPLGSLIAGSTANLSFAVFFAALLAAGPRETATGMRR